MKHPVETSSAGRSFTCSCGKTANLPSMLAMKKLPLWEDPEAAAEPKSPVSASFEAAPADKKTHADKKSPDVLSKGGKRRSLSGNRLGILIVGLGMVLIFGWFFFRTVSNPPKPIAVFQKQRDFIIDGSVVHRDSTPVTMEDFNFYMNTVGDENIGFYQMINSAVVTPENLAQVQKANPNLKVGDVVLTQDVQKGQWVEINDWLIAQMTPYMAYNYFDLLKNGPALSDNFYENLEALKTQYRLKSGLYGVLLLLSLIVCVVPWLLPKYTVTVGAQKGTEWKV